MDDGSAIILSVAKYYSPAGKSIQDEGVTPKTLVAQPEPQSADIDDETEGAPAPEAPKKPTEDVLLKKAVEVVSAK